MCTLYDRIQILCKEKGVSGSRMCIDLGISKSTLSDIKSGRKKGVSTENATKMAAYLGVTVGHLLGEENEKSPSASKPTGMPSDYFELNEENREIINLMIAKLRAGQSPD